MRASHSMQWRNPGLKYSCGRPALSDSHTPSGCKDRSFCSFRFRSYCPILTEPPTPTCTHPPMKPDRQNSPCVQLGAVQRSHDKGTQSKPPNAHFAGPELRRKMDRGKGTGLGFWCMPLLMGTTPSSPFFLLPFPPHQDNPHSSPSLPSHPHIHAGRPVLLWEVNSGDGLSTPGFKMAAGSHFVSTTMQPCNTAHLSSAATNCYDWAVR